MLLGRWMKNEKGMLCGLWHVQWNRSEEGLVQHTLWTSTHAVTAKHYYYRRCCLARRMNWKKSLVGDPPGAREMHPGHAARPRSRTQQRMRYDQKTLTFWSIAMR